MGKNVGRLSKPRLVTYSLLDRAGGTNSPAVSVIKTLLRSTQQIRTSSSITRPKSGVILTVIAMGLCLFAVATGCRPIREVRERMREQALIKQLAALEPIDAHTHVTRTSSEFVAMLDELHMHVLDILYVDDHSAEYSSLEKEKAAALKFIGSSHGRAKLCTTFDPFRINDKNFVEEAIKGLDQDFANGAVAAKVWKNVGMEIKNASGRYVLPDDPIFEPMYRDIQAHNKTLIIHAADPDAGWTENQARGSIYYATHPEWDMTKKPDAPQKAAILTARNKVLESNPSLRVIGAHLGSMEGARFQELDDVLQKHPNFAVDIAARLGSLSPLPRDEVRRFFLKNQDRILYGTDLSYDASTRRNERDEAKEWRKEYVAQFRYLSTADEFKYRGRTVHGLELPPAVLKKVYRDNAVHWIPGLGD